MKRYLVIAVSLCAVAFVRAEAADGIIVAGGSVSGDDSAYAGAVIALPGSSLGHGWAVKAAANGGRYKYSGGVGEVSATYYGGAIGAVYQLSGKWGWANISAGARFTQTHLSPFDPGNARAGFRTDFAPSSDGAFNLDPHWRLGWYGEGGVRDRYYLTRVELTRSVGAGRWRLGAEGGVQGDPTYRKERGGAVAAVKLTPKLEAHLSGGAEFQRDGKTKPYVTLGFGLSF
ncbi:MAG TPA: cellulose biosynthesis protein BcsS [Parvularculaceae bacterium]|nr:cellulose biosynthesis protein BcsS [Parvularculaceae bacterium]